MYDFERLSRFKKSPQQQADNACLFLKCPRPQKRQRREPWYLETHEERDRPMQPPTTLFGLLRPDKREVWLTVAGLSTLHGPRRRWRCLSGIPEGFENKAFFKRTQSLCFTNRDIRQVSTTAHSRLCTQIVRQIKKRNKKKLLFCFPPWCPVPPATGVTC